MGQGRKKNIRSENGRCRRRSITNENELSDPNITHFLKVHSPVRRLSDSVHRNRGDTYTTPTTSLFTPCRHDSLVEYISNSGLPVKDNSSGFTNLGESYVENLPFISTSPISTKPSANEGMNISEQMNNFYLCIFPNNIIYMNGKGKEISSQMKTMLLKICVHLHEKKLIQICEVAYIEKDRKDYLRFCIMEKIQRIFSFLFHQCRYENIYGLSPHSYMILGLCQSLPEVVQSAQHVLYETLLDYYECERLAGDTYEDDFYLKKSEYGQVHRLVEIWQTFVNSFYEKFSVYVFSHKEEGNQMKLLSVDSLYKSLFLLLRISGVISKYHSLLLSGILKLFYVDREGIHLFFKVILSKWPLSISKKALALLELLEGILIECKILLSSEFYNEINQVILWLITLVNQNHAEIALKSLTILNNNYILLNYIVNDEERLREIENCLNRNNSYWNDVIKQVGDELFDHLLDYV